MSLCLSDQVHKFAAALLSWQNSWPQLTVNATAKLFKSIENNAIQGSDTIHVTKRIATHYKTIFCPSPNNYCIYIGICCIYETYTLGFFYVFLNKKVVCWSCFYLGINWDKILHCSSLIISDCQLIHSKYQLQTSIMLCWGHIAFFNIGKHHFVNHINGYMISD